MTIQLLAIDLAAKVDKRRMMFAVINYNGNQYMVSPEKEYNIDLVSKDETEKKKIEFSEVLLVSDESNVSVGQPNIEGATVEAEILSEVREEKTTVRKFHSKKRYQRTIGSRDKKTRIKILNINVKAKK